MKGVVVDVSVVASWVFADERTPGTTALLRRMRSLPLVVPALWAFELANLLLNAERRGRLEPGGRTAAYAVLSGLDLRMDEPPGLQRIRQITSLASSQNLTAYDASYLELATREGLPLATRDNPLMVAAGRVGVELVAT